MGGEVSDRPGLRVGGVRATTGLGIAAALVFWGWLAARWVNDWLLVPAGLGVDKGTPFVDPALVEPLSSSAAFAMEHLPALAQGAWLTIWLTLASIAFGFVIAVPVAVARIYTERARYVAYGFTELIRGTPLLAQLFVLYYGLGLTSVIRELPGVGVGPIPDQAVWVAIIGFTINSAAYQAEYLRSAFLSVEGGQMTAARAIGLDKVEALRYVVLPQGLRLAIPGWSNELIYLIKYSSLATFITVEELFFQAENIASTNFKYAPIFTLVGLMYLALVLTATKLMDRVEDEVAIPGLGSGGRR